MDRGADRVLLGALAGSFRPSSRLKVAAQQERKDEAAAQRGKPARKPAGCSPAGSTTSALKSRIGMLALVYVLLQLGGYSLVSMLRRPESAAAADALLPRQPSVHLPATISTEADRRGGPADHKPEDPMDGSLSYSQAVLSRLTGRPAAPSPHWRSFDALLGMQPSADAARKPPPPMPPQHLRQMLAHLDDYWRQSGMVRWPGRQPGAEQHPEQLESQKCQAAAHELQQHLTAMWQQLPGTPGAAGLPAARLQMHVTGLPLVGAKLAACSPQPTAFLRRYATATLLLLSQEMGAFWTPACQQAAGQALLQLQLLHQRSLAQRAVVEFTHISKSGGTTMCMLAMRSHCRTENASTARNCLVKAFSDDPKWSLVHDLVLHNGSRTPFKPFCAYECPQHLTAPRAGCRIRRSFAMANAWNFYSQEQAVHDVPDTYGGGGGGGGSRTSELCGEMVNVVTIRDPWEHMNSLVGELQDVYLEESSRRKLMGVRLRMLWEYSAVAEWAPAVVNGYTLRTLLGRSYMCGDKLHRPLGLRELRAGQALLAQYDAVLTLGRDELNDPVLQTGLGWVGKTMAHYTARKKNIFSKNDTGEAVKKRLGIDTQLYYFAANITTLDAHFFTAAELLLADEPALQRAARAMHALSWHFQPRHPEPAGGRPTGAGSSASAQASGQGQMAAPAGTGRSSTTSSPALLGRQLMPTGEPDAAAAKQANAAEAEARYVQPSGMQVGAACGWAGLQISDG